MSTPKYDAHHFGDGYPSFWEPPICDVLKCAACRFRVYFFVGSNQRFLPHGEALCE